MWPGREDSNFLRSKKGLNLAIMISGNRIFNAN
jgi:hypothetical protein